MKKHSIVIQGHATSVSLEDPFWMALKEIAQQRTVSIVTLITEIDNSPKNKEQNLSSKIRIYILEHYRCRKAMD